MGVYWNAFHAFTDGIKILIIFSVMCTAPNKYTVVDPEGSIKPQCCIDIVLRHNATTSSNCHVTDKFRIQMQDLTTKQVFILNNSYY